MHHCCHSIQLESAAPHYTCTSDSKVARTSREDAAWLSTLVDQIHHWPVPCLLLADFVLNDCNDIGEFLPYGATIYEEREKDVVDMRQYSTVILSAL
jgi:hypothetical protein